MDAVPILIVDNYAGLRETVRMLLTQEGYLVYEAFTGHEAVDYLRMSPQPLVVLLDWYMPGLSGRGVLETLAAHVPQARRHAYILYTSADRPYDLLAQVPPGFHVTALSKFSGIDAILDAVKRTSDQITGADKDTTEQRSGHDKDDHRPVG